MFIYNTIFVILAILAYGSILLKINKNTEKRIFVIIILIFIVLSAIRSNVGTDFQGYYNRYLSVGEWDFNGAIATGDIGYLYMILNVLIKSIFNHYFFMLLCVAVITLGFTSKAVFKLSNQYLVCLYCWWAISFCDIFAVRLTIAGAIFFYAISKIQCKDIKGYFACIILAMLFHPSALVLIPAYYIYHKKFKTKHIIIITIFIVVLIILGGIILPFIGNMLGGVYARKISGYMFRNTTANNYWFSLCKYILNKGSLFVIFTFIKKRYNTKTDEKKEVFNGCYKLYIYGIIISLIGFNFGTVLGRAAAYFYTVELIMLPHVFNILRDKESKTIVFILFSIYLFLRMYISFSSYGGELFIYKTIFSTSY